MPPEELHALTKADLETWLDGLLPFTLKRGDVAGAVVMVVKDGAILSQKGYGYSDVAKRTPVDPERTLFRVASISKLFTWTAVMQLRELGKLDLDTDINMYLDFKVPPYEGQPITLRNLMTHTPGFDERERGVLLVYDAAQLRPLGEQVREWIPARVTAPGTIPAYSNYGAALAGYIVQRVSGEAFEEYIERHIFAPLGMTYATFRQPLPPELERWMAKGYQVGSGIAKPFEIDLVPPDGAASVSGADLARFMIAHLQNGAFESNRILQEATAIQMHTTAFTVIPPLNRMLLGFYENNINGHRVIAHGGDLQFFHGELNLFIDDGVGLFICLNSVGKDNAARAIRTAFLEQFSNRYFPGTCPEGSIDPTAAKEHAQAVAGRYVFSRRSHETFLSVTNLLGEMQVLEDQGTITVPDLKGVNGAAKKWREIAPFVWRDEEGCKRIAARMENGRAVLLGYDPLPFMPWQPVEWWRSGGWLLPLLKVSSLILALSALAWPASALIRRYYGAAYGLTGRQANAHRLVQIASILVLAIALAWVVCIQLISGDFEWAGPRMDIWIASLRVLSLIMFVAGAAVAMWNVWVVFGSQRKWLVKLWGLLLALSFLTMLYLGVVFHLVGYTADY